MDILSQILDNGSELTTNMQMFLLMTALMFLPTIIFMMTSFVRVIITFSFIKSAYFILRYDLCVNIHIYFVNSESSEQVECAIFITFINLKNCVYEYIRINKRHVVSILLFLCLLYECASKKH